MTTNKYFFTAVLIICTVFPGTKVLAQKIQHDAEHYILLAQNGKRWQADDQRVEAKLEEIRKKNGGKRPNLVYILLDDLGFGSLGSRQMNYVNGYNTPNINDMARNGVSFMRMYTEPVCTPTRVAVTTGRYPVRAGVNETKVNISGQGLPAEEVTMAEVLSKSGYRTVHIGKWHLGDIEQSWPHNQGFDYAEFPIHQQGQLAVMTEEAEAAGIISGLHSRFHGDQFILDRSFRWDPAHLVIGVEASKGGKAREVHMKAGESWTEAKYRELNERYQNHTIDQLRSLAAGAKKGDNPFFLQYWPLYPLKFTRGDVEQYFTRNGGTITEGIEEVDAWVGDIIDEIEKQGIAENTLLVVMGDNGPFMQYLDKTGQSDRIYRGGKGQHLEGGVRVDAFAQWSGVIEADSAVGDMIHISDLFTTFARIAGAQEYIPRDRIIDGVDQSSLLLLGENHGRRDYLFIYEGPKLRSTVKEHYKIHWPSPGDGPMKARMFDLLRDPREERGMDSATSFSRIVWSSNKWLGMMKRHMGMQMKFPNRKTTRGEPYTGIENLRPETIAVKNRFMQQNGMFLK